MELTLAYHAVLFLLQFKLAVTAGNIDALDDEECDIIIWKISGDFYEPLGERTLLEKIQ